MIEDVPKNLLQDKNGLFFLKKSDIEKNSISFYDCFIKNGEMAKAFFYCIKGNNSYIVKKHNFLNRKKEQDAIIEMLEHFKIISKLLNKVDLPIGYYKELGKVKGIIIPYYENAISIMNMMLNYSLDDIKKIYFYDDDNIYNLFHIFLEIISLIEEMYENQMFYYDINDNNFLIYQNEIKVIDFEPYRVIFNEDTKTFPIIAFNYLLLLNEILKKYQLMDNDLVQKTFDYRKIMERTSEFNYDFNKVKAYVKKIENNIRKG